MSIRLKQRILCIAVVVLTLWPLAHHFLVERYGLNKWSFMGFSMYISKRPVYPRESIRTSVFGAQLDVPQQAAIARAILRYQRLRFEYGQLYDPARLAREVFEVAPPVQRFSVEYDVLNMNRETAKFEGQRVQYAARRGAGDEDPIWTEESRPVPER
ncbi:MAG: hypothetical protein DWQ31_17925 [Planctomycetota bacterium]|nr:MAG: hypothetical protein DWQ31_17925 [Planctomycetota bacterium]REJ97361.1 MAG: hypothetical protein DWQ35_02045 [Planctomycetota bacterium]